MFYAITVKDGWITGLHESMKPITDGTFARSPDYAGQKVVPVPEGTNVERGSLVAFYDADWRLKPLSQCVAEGLIVIEPGYVLDGETIREMTSEEKSQQEEYGKMKEV